MMTVSSFTSLRSPRRCITLLLILCCVTVAQANRSARALFQQPKTSYPLPEPPQMADYGILDDIVEEAEGFIANEQKTLEGLKRFRLAGMLGHSGALTTAAALLLIGDRNIKRDIPAAVRYLEKAANDGQPDAQALLGSLHASGLAERHGVSKSIEHAILYWTFAAEASNVHASTALAFRYLYGLGVKKSCAIAARHYRRAAQAIATDPRVWPTAHNFMYSKPPLPSGLVNLPPVRLNDTTLAGEKDVESDQDIVQFYRHSADRQDTTSRTILGALYYFGGHGIEPDEVEAVRQLNIAADANNAEAHAMLGHIDMAAGRNESSLKHFIYSAGSENNPLAHYALGMIHKHGLLGQNSQLSRAKMHFELANDRERHGGACFELGLLYWTGSGVQRDVSKAFKYFEKGASAGNLQCKLYVGTILIDGSAPVGTADCQRGVQLLKEVAEEGEWVTLLELGMESVDNDDYYGALHRFLQAGHAGIELGQHNAAFLLERMGKAEFPELEHWDRKRMLQEAYELYELSAVQGHTDSLIRSANMMYSELKDYAGAARTFEKAAGMKNAEGMVSLGLMHAQGIGVEQNRQLAVSYLNLASRADEEALAPATVALLGLRIYWVFEDFYKRASQICIWFQSVLGRLEGQGENGVIATVEKARRQRKDGPQLHAQETSMYLLSTDFLYYYSGDVAVIGVLLVALFMVLFLRTKRIARQMSTHVDDGVESERHVGHTTDE